MQKKSTINKTTKLTTSSTCASSAVQDMVELRLKKRKYNGECEIKLAENEEFYEYDSTLSNFGVMVKTKDKNQRYFVCLASSKCQEDQKRIDARNAQRHLKACCPTFDEEKFVFHSIFGREKLMFCSTNGHYRNSFTILNFKSSQTEHLVPGILLSEVNEVLGINLKTSKPNVVFRFDYDDDNERPSDFFVRQQDIVQVIDFKTVSCLKSSSCVLVLDLDETVVSLQHQNNSEEIRHHNLRIAENDSFQVEYQGKIMQYVVRPYFSEFKTLVMKGNVDVIVYSHSHQYLAEAIVSTLRMNTKSIHGRRPKEECISKCLSHIPEVFNYEHILILDDDPSNFTHSVSSIHNQVHRLSVTKFYWQNYDRDTNLRAISSTIQSIVSTCQN